MATVVQSRQAEADVGEIDVYVRRRDAVAADRLLAAIDATFHLLAASPFVGRAREELASDLRGLSVPSFPNYIVFYRPTGDGIAVVRVLHGARDLSGELRNF